MNMQKPEMKTRAAPRRGAARLAAALALYEMEFTGRGADAVVDEFRQHRFGDPNVDYGDADALILDRVDEKLFAEIAAGAAQRQDDIDTHIRARLTKGWSLTRIDSTVRAVLRAAVYELIAKRDVPARVIIDEYIDVTKAFFETDEPTFVNGVLDAIAHETRADEFTPKA